MKVVLYPVMLILNAIVLLYVFVITALYFGFVGRDTSEFSAHPDRLVLLMVAIAAPASALVYGFRKPWKQRGASNESAKVLQPDAPGRSPVVLRGVVAHEPGDPCSLGRIIVAKESEWSGLHEHEDAEARHPLAPPNAVTDGQNLGRMKNARREMVGGR